MKVTLTNAGVPIGAVELTVHRFREPGGPAAFAAGELAALPAFDAVAAKMRPAIDRTALCAASEGAEPAHAPAAPHLPLALLDERGMSVPAIVIVLYRYGEPPRTLVMVQLADAGAAVAARLPPRRAQPGDGARPDLRRGDDAGPPRPSPGHP